MKAKAKEIRTTPVKKIVMRKAAAYFSTAGALPVSVTLSCPPWEVPDGFVARRKARDKIHA